MIVGTTDTNFTDSKAVGEIAQDGADNANNGLSDINSDNRLTPFEKAQIKKEYESDVIRHDLDVVRLQAVNLSTADIDSALNNLTAIITPYLTDMTTTEDIDRATIEAAFSAFLSADKAVDKLVSDTVQSIANDAKQAGDEAQKAAEDAKSDSEQALKNADVAQSSATDAISKANELDSKVISLSDDVTAKYSELDTGLKSVVSDVNGVSTQITQLDKVISAKVGTDDFNSEIEILQNDINLRVKSGEVINQINVDASGVLIAGEKVHITGETLIDNAVIGTAQIADAAINDAKISNLNGNKIIAGSITSEQLNSNEIIANVIDGATITGNTINGGRLSIDSSNIVQGDGTINPGIDITATGSSSVNGDLNWTERYWLDQNGFHERYNATRERPVDFSVWINQGSISFLSGGGRPENHRGEGSYIDVNQAELGFTSVTQLDVPNGTLNVSLDGSDPSMSVDSDTTGSRIQAMPVYTRTYSMAANVRVTAHGVLGLATSASKYKTAISEIPDALDKGNDLLSLRPKRWYDKAVVEDVVREMNGGTPDDDRLSLRYYVGLIAEDLRDAGLDDFIDYDDKGEINGIQYDRLFILLLPVIKNIRDEVLELKTEKIKENING